MAKPVVPATVPEHRTAFASLKDIEYRQAGNGEDFTLTGHAAVFDSWSEDLITWAGTFRERIAPGAFTKVLADKPDVRLLFNHEGLTLARTKAETLELEEDDEGLHVWARLAPTQVAQDLRMAMQRGDVDQMSFAFTVAEDEWHEDADEEEIERTILRIGELFDVSVVSFPAYPDTDAAIRELRSAADAGKITIAARAETDPAGDAANGDTPEGAPAETDPAVEEVGPLAALRAASTEAVQREREMYLLVAKEITR